MSSLEDKRSSVIVPRKDRYAAAVAEIERSRRVEQGQAGATVFAALAFGDALESNKRMSQAAHVSKLICIAALFLIPNLLVLRVLL